MSALNHKQQPSRAPISKATEIDGEEAGSIHPATWMAIGGGSIGIVVVLAVLLGFFDRQTTPAVATPPVVTTPAPVAVQTTRAPDSGWVDDLWGPSAKTVTAESRGKSTNSVPIVGEASDSSKASRPWESDPIVGKPATYAAPDQSRKQLSPEDLYEQVAPSVVTIKVKDENEQPIATGSGFFIDEQLLSEPYKSLELSLAKRMSTIFSNDGVAKQNAYVLTNYHVVRPAVSADVILANGHEGTAYKVVAEDQHADLALLSVYVPADQPAKGIPLARSDPRVLAVVYAIGSPKGLSGSASEGRVSGFRELPEGERWLQTTAPISHGSSGGPLLLADGTLVGVTTLILNNAQNVNFAVRVSKVREFLSSEYRPRDIAKGASIRWDEEDAITTMHAELESPTGSYSNAAKNAGQLLEKARQEVHDRFLDKSRQQIAHCERAIALAQQADQALPKEFQYLVQYTIGEASFWLEYATRSHNNSTLAQDQARYRASSLANSAYNHLVQATILKPDFSPPYHLLWLHHTDGGKWPEALLASDTLVKLMPRCAEAFESRAKCCDELGRYEAAKHDLEAAIELAPRRASLHHELGFEFFSLNDYSQAIDCYERAIEVGLESYEKSSVYFDLGNAYKLAGNLRKAIAAYEMARSLNGPTSPPGVFDHSCDEQIAKCKAELH
jgi:S1-C subfamily serine protease/tetratricopeptide (TPR) repeat protein